MHCRINKRSTLHCPLALAMATGDSDKSHFNGSGGIRLGRMEMAGGKLETMKTQCVQGISPKKKKKRSGLLFMCSGWVSMGMGSRTPTDTQIMDAQVPYVPGQSAVGPLYPQIWRVDSVLSYEIRLVFTRCVLPEL